MKEAIRLYNMKRYGQALKEFLSLDLDPSRFPELSYYLGLCYTQLGKYDEALLYLEQVVTSQIDFLHIFQCRMVLGYIYAITGRFRLAEFELEKLLEEGYESAKVYAALGFVFFSEKKHEKSIEMYKKALSLEPDNANALNSLGYVLGDTGKDLDAALRYCKKAVTMNPGSAAYLDSLGWIYFQRGNREEARRYLRRALDAAPGNKEIASHLKSLLETGE